MYFMAKRRRGLADRFCTACCHSNALSVLGANSFTRSAGIMRVVVKQTTHQRVDPVSRVGQSERLFAALTDGIYIS